MPKTVTLSVVTPESDALQLALINREAMLWNGAAIAAAIVAIAGLILIGLDPAGILPQDGWIKPVCGISDVAVGSIVVGLLKYQANRTERRNGRKAAHYERLVELGQKIATAVDATTKKRLNLLYLQTKHDYHAASHYVAFDGVTDKTSKPIFNLPVREELHKYVEPIVVPDTETRTTITYDPFNGLCSVASSYAASIYYKEGKDAVMKLFEKGVPFEAVVSDIVSCEKPFQTDLFNSLWTCYSRYTPGEHLPFNQAKLEFNEHEDREVIVQIFDHTKNFLFDLDREGKTYLEYMKAKIGKEKLEKFEYTLSFIEKSMNANKKISGHGDFVVARSMGLTMSDPIKKRTFDSDGVYFIGLNLSTSSGRNHAALLIREGNDYVFMDINDRIYHVYQPNPILLKVFQRYNVLSVDVHQLTR